MKKTTVLATLCLLLPLAASEAGAAPASRFDETTKTCRVLNEGPLEWATRAWGEGGQLFKKVCKSCHSQGNAQGAPFLWTESMTSKGWNRVFTTRYPECARNGAWDRLTQEQLLVVNDYLYRWAKGAQDISDSC